MKDIILTAINAKWIHPSLALRLLKANLGFLEDSCEIIEFALRQPLREKIEPLIAARPRVLGVSVSIWNHAATIELLTALREEFPQRHGGAEERGKPIIVLGGPEVSHLPPDAEIFQYADYVIRGEGETAFKMVCEEILSDKNNVSGALRYEKFINADINDLSKIKTAYHLYTDEDLAKKLIYAEASRGCPFNCEFCLSAVESKVREFPLDQFLAEMDILIQRGAKTFKFLDRSFNINIKRSLRIIEFFLEKISASQRLGRNSPNIVVHFEMVPSILPKELREALARFQCGALRLEIGIQTLNEDTASRISRPSNPEKELEAIRLLRKETNAVIHADLIAGLPGESLASFGKGFDRLWDAMNDNAGGVSRNEIQLGILKLLPGTPISRHNKEFGMRFNPLPPYEIEENSSISATDMRRIKNMARFWELIVNRGLVKVTEQPVFEKFMAVSDALMAHFGRNWGIDKEELAVKLKQMLVFSDLK